MRVLGIDPGSLITGYGIVDTEKGKLYHVSDGSISTNSKVKSLPSNASIGGQKHALEGFNQGSKLQDRLNIIFDLLFAVIMDYRPDAVAIEEIFFARNVKSAIMLGHARGVALLCAGKAGLPVFEYSPLKIKQSVVGYGNATKEQVQKMVKILLNMPKTPKADASDALATAICHIHHNKSQKLKAKSQN